MIMHFLYDFSYVGDQLEFAVIDNGILMLIVSGIMASPCGTRRARYTGQTESICTRLAFVTMECFLVSVQYRHRRLLFWGCRVFGGQRLFGATIIISYRLVMDHVLVMDIRFLQTAMDLYNYLMDSLLHVRYCA